MIEHIFFTKKAQKDFKSIHEYIKLTFGNTAADRFNNTVARISTLLQNYPDVGTIELEEKGIRCFVVHYRLKLFYRVKNNKLIILRLFDTRQNPSNR